jgi:hypothetical protein
MRMTRRGRLRISNLPVGLIGGATGSAQLAASPHHRRELGAGPDQRTLIDGEDGELLAGDALVVLRDGGQDDPLALS